MLSNFCINFLQLWRILMGRQKYVEWTFIFDFGMELNVGGCGGWNNFLQDWSWSTSIQGSSKLQNVACLFFQIIESRNQRKEKAREILESRIQKKEKGREILESRNQRKEEAREILDSRIQRTEKVREILEFRRETKRDS